MKIVKLIPKENTKFHFGQLNLRIDDFIFHSDSLFGAIINNYIHLFGLKKLSEFVYSFPSISSLFYGIVNENGKDVFFIPSPMGPYLPTSLLQKDRKLLKKIKFISLGYYHKLIHNDLQADEIRPNKNYRDLLFLEEEHLADDISLYDPYVEEKVKIDRKTGTVYKDSLYSVSSIMPKEKVFFYFLIDSNTLSKPMIQSIKLIESFGIGGERSVGYGMIEKIMIAEYNCPTNMQENTKYMNLSLVHPLSEEEINIIKRGQYNLVLRKGRTIIYDSNGRMRNDIKKNPMFYVKEGGIFDKQLKGSIREEAVELSKKQTIYRYGKAFMLPIKFFGDKNESNRDRKNEHNKM